MNRVDEMSLHDVPDVITLDLVHEVFDQFQLDLVDTLHGPHHWGRVMENGLKMAEINGANKRVVALFALFHDSKRVCENYDEKHGPRAAVFARDLLENRDLITNEELKLLRIACKGHTVGLHNSDITVGTCWDADRLDLGRCDIEPDPKYFSTDTAQQIYDWAVPRGQRNHKVDYVDSHWLGLYI